jgi:purine-binding chemotaxis protein CheW
MTTLQQLQADPHSAATLRERAQMLARPLAAADTDRSEPILRFLLGSDHFAIPAAAAQSVQPLSRYTPLPATPPWLLGLVNVRGRLLATIDIRPLLALAPAPPRPGALLVIVREGEISIALLADAVLGVDQITTRLVPQPANAPGLAAPWIQGVDEALNIHCDLPRLIAHIQILADTIELPGGAHS